MISYLSEIGWKYGVSRHTGKEASYIVYDMVHVNGGSFIICIHPKQAYVIDEEEVITRMLTVSSFQIGRYQVTQEEWKVVIGSNPSKHIGASRSVECVGWRDCQEFIKRLNDMTGMCFRLPTEAKWEFAAPKTVAVIIVSLIR